MAAERALYYYSRKRKQRLVCFILQAPAKLVMLRYDGGSLPQLSHSTAARLSASCVGGSRRCMFVSLTREGHAFRKACSWRCNSVS
ncbi:hypothetical protein IG631_15776 [Alternaria alternata]|nr:hypothetical protein IG631_15776 [Alternaria alternata]